MRAVDTAARIGGDEFALLLSEADDVHAHRSPSASTPRCTSTRHGALARHDQHRRQRLDTDGVSLDDLLRHADSRLYLAKRRSVRTRAELDAAA